MTALKSVKSCTITPQADGAMLDIVWQGSGPIPFRIAEDGSLIYRDFTTEERQIMRGVAWDVVEDFCRVWGVKP